MLRICRNCRREYEGAPGSTMCPTCVAEQRKNVIRDRICRACGATFPGGPRAWYCPECRHQRRLEQSRTYRKTGSARQLGSIDHCEICGGEYVVNSGMQRYCPQCAPEAVSAVDRAQGAAWYAANADPGQRKQIRRDHTAELVCVVCGKVFVPHDSSITCSKECSEIHQKDIAKRFEQTNRDQRNAQHSQNRKTRLDAMTPEEREARRLEINRKQRENYRKRKERANGRPPK